MITANLISYMYPYIVLTHCVIANVYILYIYVAGRRRIRIEQLDIKQTFRKKS